ncbi:hypothetical protein DIPPA_32716 [Diplonema papillatum]|nr:hypothetical protein DIPPA_32716 [Diplonema papillatum]
MKASSVPSENPTVSYWMDGREPLLDQPDEVNDGETADVVIIGGGLSGLATAYWLLRKESGDMSADEYSMASVVVLEARTLGAGPLQDLADTHGFAAAAALWDFETDTCRRAAAFVERATPQARQGIDMQTRGFVALCRFDDEVKDAATEVALLRKAHPDPPVGIQYGNAPCVLGPEGTDRVLRGEAQAGGPGEPLYIGSLRSPAASWRPFEFARAALQTLAGLRPRGEPRAGGQLKLVERATVTSVTRAGAAGPFEVAYSLAGSDGPRDKTLKARAVVFATNGYSQYLHPALEHITSVRGQCLKVDTVVPCNLGWDDCDTYVAPVQDGCVLGGKRAWCPTLEVAVTNDSSIDPHVAEGLDGALTYLRSIVGASAADPPKTTHHWTGIMAFTPDRLPLVGSCDDGLFCLGGYTGGGHA